MWRLSIHSDQLCTRKFNNSRWPLEEDYLYWRHTWNEVQVRVSDNLRFNPQLLKLNYFDSVHCSWKLIITLQTTYSSTLATSSQKAHMSVRCLPLATCTYLLHVQAIDMGDFWRGKDQMVDNMYTRIYCTWDGQGKRGFGESLSRSICPHLWSLSFYKSTLSPGFFRLDR